MLFVILLPYPDAIDVLATREKALVTRRFFRISGKETGDCSLFSMNSFLFFFFLENLNFEFT